MAAPESSAWVSSYNLFSDRKRTDFITGSNELLVSHTYPHADYDAFRTCCDFVNLLFVIDEISDDQSGKAARRTGEVYLNAMRDPEWTDGSDLAKMTQQYALARFFFASYAQGALTLTCTLTLAQLIIRRFRARFLRSVGPQSFRRFLRHSEHYIDCVAKEAEYRERGQVLDMDSFKSLRRENSAIRLCFGLFEFTLGIDLPDSVFEDETFMKMYWASADMVCWANVSDTTHIHLSPSLPLLSILGTVDIGADIRHNSVGRTCTRITLNKLRVIVGITSLLS